MRVFIPAAGRGTRLGSLTASKPKALVEVNGVPLLQRLIENLKAVGFNEFVVNIHHFGDQIISFLETHNYFETNIRIADERNTLLDTGGGLVNASSHFAGDEPFLVHNVDVISDYNLAEIYRKHVQSDAEISLVTMQRETSRYLLFDHNNRLCGWENVKTGEKINPGNISELVQYAFAGIQMVNPSLLKYIATQESRAVFPVIPAYLSVCREHKIVGLPESYSYWLDLGKPAALKEASLLIEKRNSI